MLYDVFIHVDIKSVKLGSALRITRANSCLKVSLTELI